MRLGHKGIAVFVVLLGFSAVGGYQLLNSKNGDSNKVNQSAVATVKKKNEKPLNHPQVEGKKAVGTDLPKAHPKSNFSHFRVGNRNVKSLFTEGDYVWVGSSGGVIRYNTLKDEYKVFDNRVEGILSNGVFHVSKVNGQIIIGTYGGGLSLYNDEKDSWENYNIPQGLADQFVYDVTTDSKGDVWIATWSGVNRIRQGEFNDPEKWTMFTMENTQGGIPNPWVYGVEEGLNGDMWFATEEGLARYRDGNWTNWQHDDGLGADYEQVADAIKATSDPAKSSQHHAHQKTEQGLNDVKVAYNPNYIISLQVDKNGIVWCGTWGGGLARFDGKTWRNYTTEDGLPGNHIFMLYIDEKDNIWAGTSQGLAKLSADENSFSVLTTRDGLYANNVFSMANADDGSVWIGSFGGVARLSDINL